MFIQLLVTLVAAVFCLFIYRRGIRALWKCFEEYKRQTRERESKFRLITQNAFSTLASKVYGTSIKFRSQNGEDMLVYAMFGGKAKGTFLELGAYDGLAFSNTYVLERLGWTGVLVEALPQQFAKCKVNRPNSIVVHAAVGSDPEVLEMDFIVAQGAEMLSAVTVDACREKRLAREGAHQTIIRVPCKTLKSILLDHGVTDLDFVSLDVEGHELAALEGFPFNLIKPRLFLIENGGPDSDIGVVMRCQDYTQVFELEGNWFWMHNKANLAT